MGEINQDCRPDPDRKLGSGLEDALDAPGLLGSRRQVHPNPDRKSGKVGISLTLPDFLSRNSRKLAQKHWEKLWKILIFTDFCPGDSRTVILTRPEC